ncbi:Fpg/Nei family DNA glycosylase [Nocardioides sp. ChNu-153]|uniref:Fpg/Nei family DNA glycosylase n=1 Tax=unclassified Nocardioides TaxID=2615069 RepID=UPI002406DB3D|nr:MULTISPECIES: DNA-formamidopyrimidine glycosylase family protein [unclassified Nocardioides]MDF9716340.1 Fpg/Nei family DNA glycosylase [Nocardioides sp. ChNu-99]MDN7122846.1 Fpg/Nei family DNA glycosylase [Nocardioides sp. ChNu-153]
MPEGHTLHRLAHDLGDAFAGRVVRVSSPQGRFATEAALLDGAVLEGAQAWGKHLFLDLGADRFVHVHLGLYGTFVLGATAVDDAVPAPVGQVRLRLVAARDDGGAAWADLRGATACELVTGAGVRAVADRLGPDPLRDDADPDRGWARIGRSRAPLAALLMDQTVLAGVGNVYRAEVLFRHRLDPYRPGESLRRRRYDELWADLVDLMHDGVRTGRIDTVRPEHTPEAMGREPRVDDHGGEVYVYRRDGLPCLVCGSPVRRAELAQRNLFWCGRCQRRHVPRGVQ